MKLNILKLNPKLNTIFFTILHFSVDGLCGLLIFSTLYNIENSYELNTYIFLMYNIMAFVMQPIVGILADKIKNHKIILIISIMLLLVAYVISFSPIIAPIVLGLGNAFFHISGGEYVSSNTNNDIISLGVFVSSGAIGLVLGQLYYSDILLIVFFILLILFSIPIVLSKEVEANNNNPIDNKNINIIILVIIVAIVTFFRSFIGKAAPTCFDVQGMPYLLLLIGIASAFGKACGGVFSKLIGVDKTIIISYISSTLLLIFGNKYAIFYILGIFFFNFSMPITLYYINILMPKRKALAFGILAAMLFPGYLLGLLPFKNIVICILMVIINLLSIIMIIYVKKKVETCLK